MAQNVRVSINMLVRGVKSILAERGKVTPATLVEEFGLNESGARKVLATMVESGDIDRVGSRRAGYEYVKMSPEREAELAPVIACREEVLAKLAKAGYDSAQGTLSRITLSLADAAKMLGVEVPDALIEVPETDEDE